MTQNLKSTCFKFLYLIPIIGFALMIGYIWKDVDSLSGQCVRYQNCSYVDDNSVNNNQCIISIPGTKYSCRHLGTVCPQNNHGVCYIYKDNTCPIDRPCNNIYFVRVLIISFLLELFFIIGYATHTIYGLSCQKNDETTYNENILFYDRV